MKTLKMNLKKSVSFTFILFLLLTACVTPSTESKAQSDAPVVDIHGAIIGNDINAVEQYIKSGGDLNKKEPFANSTPLITAATFGRSEISQKLIDAGADLSIVNNDGSTALHAAAFFGRVEVVQVLIDAQADKTIKNNFGATPRESVLVPFDQMKPVYEMMKQQMAPMGLELDIVELEKTLPTIAVMLQ